MTFGPGGLVDFDGEASLVLVHEGVRLMDVRQDLYSDWKEFAHTGTNLRYEPAFRTVGGDPLRIDRTLGDSYFITNSWHILPAADTSHQLLAEGNLFSEEGEVINNAATGSVTVNFVVERAIDTFRDTVFTSGSIVNALTTIQAIQLDELYLIHGLQTGTPMEVSDTARTAGVDVVQTVEDDTPVPDTVRVTRT